MSIGEQFLGVLGDIGEWITSTITGFTSIFYNAESGITVLGWVTIASLGMAVALLLFNTVRDMLRFR